jgi:molybdate transport system substrate-binding protein
MKIERYRSGLMLAPAVALTLIAAGCSSGAGASSSGSDSTAGGSGSQSVELVVSAAASLTDSLQQVGHNYEARHPNVKVRFNFGASGTLQQQIEQGAPADLFFSAGKANMQALVDKGLVDKSQMTTVLTNELVLVVPKGAATVNQLSDLAQPSFRHVALGEPQSVPAGGYAKQALTSAKLWDALQPKLVYGKDVRQVLTYVETGNADAGFVYKTDALTSKQAVVAQTVDAKLYEPVQYPEGIVKETRHMQETKELYDYLQSKEAADVFAGFGFTPASR